LHFYEFPSLTFLLYLFFEPAGRNHLDGRFPHPPPITIVSETLDIDQSTERLDRADPYKLFLSIG
jgi:hypothetical protein